MSDYLSVLKDRLNRLQEEAEALEQVIYILEKQEQKSVKKRTSKHTTSSGLSFTVSEEIRPAIEPAETNNEIQIDDDFDVNNIPNRQGGILDL